MFLFTLKHHACPATLKPMGRGGGGGQARGLDHRILKMYYNTGNDNEKGKMMVYHTCYEHRKPILVRK